MKSVGTFPKINWADVLRDPKARNAFEVLTQKGASPDRLREMVELAVGGQLVPRSLDLFFVDEMSREKVAGFPTALRVVAEQIERIRDNPQFHLKPGTVPAIVNLPASLRQYAEDMGRTMEFGRVFMKKNPRYFDLASIFKLKLLRYIQQTTRDPRFPLVADLLYAAFSAGGMEVDIDAGSLRKLYVRQSKQNPASTRRRD